MSSQVWPLSWALGPRRGSGQDKAPVGLCVPLSPAASTNPHSGFQAEVGPSCAPEGSGLAAPGTSHTTVCRSQRAGQPAEGNSVPAGAVGCPAGALRGPLHRSRNSAIALEKTEPLSSTLPPHRPEPRAQGARESRLWVAVAGASGVLPPPPSCTPSCHTRLLLGQEFKNTA